MRNASVDEKLLQHLRAEDTMASYARLPPNAKRDVSALPPTIAIAVPVADGGGVLQVMTDGQTRKNAWVELSEHSIAVVREALLARIKRAATAPRGKRAYRNARERVACSYASIKPDYRRKTVYVRYTDADGQPKTKHARCSAFNAETMATAENELVEFCRNHHYTEVGPGEFEARGEMPGPAVDPEESQSSEGVACQSDA